MNTLLLIAGPNGVGKSTAGQALHERLPGTARLESEWGRMERKSDGHHRSAKAAKKGQEKASAIFASVREIDHSLPCLLDSAPRIGYNVQSAFEPEIALSF